jgi:hypothetical protein
MMAACGTMDLSWQASVMDWQALQSGVLCSTEPFMRRCSSAASAPATTICDDNKISR